MKIKSIILAGVLLFTLLSVSAIYADTYVIGNSTFSMPDGFTLSEKDNQVVLYNEDVAITMYEGPIIDPYEAQQTRIDRGYTFLGDANYTYAGAKINQQNYNMDGVKSCVYTLEKNGKTYIITLNVDEDYPVPELEDNPVTEIIYSLT